MIKKGVQNDVKKLKIENIVLNQRVKQLEKLNKDLSRQLEIKEIKIADLLKLIEQSDIDFYK